MQSPVFPEDALRASLARLVTSELVFRRGTPLDAVYTFKHALVQDAAHGRLLRSTRRQLHAQIAEALETLSSELMETQPELFLPSIMLKPGSSKNLSRIGARPVIGPPPARRWRKRPRSFKRGLDQLGLLPDTRERQRQELELRSGLGPALLYAKGYAAPETGDAYARARKLWEELGSPSEFLGVPSEQSVYHLYRGELDLAPG